MQCTILGQPNNAQMQCNLGAAEQFNALAAQSWGGRARFLIAPPLCHQLPVVYLIINDDDDNENNDDK